MTRVCVPKTRVPAPILVPPCGWPLAPGPLPACSGGLWETRPLPGLSGRLAPSWRALSWRDDSAAAVPLAGAPLCAVALSRAGVVSSGPCCVWLVACCCQQASRAVRACAPPRLSSSACTLCCSATAVREPSDGVGGTAAAAAGLAGGGGGGGVSMRVVDVAPAECDRRRRGGAIGPAPAPAPAPDARRGEWPRQLTGSGAFAGRAESGRIGDAARARSSPTRVGGTRAAADDIGSAGAVSCAVPEVRTESKRLRTCFNRGKKVERAALAWRGTEYHFFCAAAAALNDCCRD